MAGLRAVTRVIVAVSFMIGNLSSGLPVPQDAQVVMPQNVEGPVLQQVNGLPVPQDAQVVMPQNVEGPAIQQVNGLPVPQDAQVVMPQNVEGPAIQQVNGDVMNQELPQSQNSDSSSVQQTPVMIGPMMEESVMETPMSETQVIPMAMPADGEITQELPQSQKTESSPAPETPVMIGPMVEEASDMLPMVVDEPLAQESQLEAVMKRAPQLVDEKSRPDCPEMEAEHHMTVVPVPCEDKESDIFHTLPSSNKDTPSSPEISNVQQ